MKKICEYSIIATGGYAKLIAVKIKSIDKIVPDLTLQGLKLIWDKWRIKNV